MSVKRTVAGAMGVIFGGMLALVVAGAPAQAAQAAPKAPVKERSAAVSPDISPAAERIRYTDAGASYSCPSERACLEVWDPTRSQNKIFDLYFCGTYTLSNWFGSGSLRNAQSGGAVVRTYDGIGALIASYPASTGVYPLNWDPVWYVSPC